MNYSYWAVIHDPRTRRSYGSTYSVTTRLLITYYYILVPWTTISSLRSCTTWHAIHIMCPASVLGSLWDFLDRNFTCHFESHHYSLHCPFFQSISDLTWYRAHVGHPLSQPTTSRRCQTYISDTDYLALSIVSHHYIAMIPDCVSRETFSRRSYMERCTWVDQPGALFTCKICSCLLTNEHDLLLTCGYGWCTLLFRNLPGFDILRGNFVLLKVSTILLEVSRVSTIETCELTSGLGPSVGFVSPLWTCLSVPSSPGMLSHIWLRLG